MSSVFYTPADDTPSISMYNQPTVNLLRVGQGQLLEVTTPKIACGSVVFVGGEKLPAMSYALCPNLKKCLIFAIGEGS